MAEAEPNPGKGGYGVVLRSGQHCVNSPAVIYLQPKTALNDGRDRWT